MRRYLPNQVGAGPRSTAGIMLAMLTICLLLPTRAMGAPFGDLWAFWDEHNSQSQQVVDHSRWQAFLDSYLHEYPDGINRVAYTDVTPAARKSLNTYIGELAAIDPRTLNRSTQFAYWVNLYNALTVEVVLRYPDADSILRMGEKFFARGPWDDKLMTVADQALTLNDIEHRILRPIWRDHRIHFAVNCASLGCPNLSARAYTPALTEALLSEGESNYINHARGLRFEANGTLTISSIFDWYGEDFANSDTALLKYLADQHTSLRGRLRNHTGRIRDEYDWRLNAHP